MVNVIDYLRNKYSQFRIQWHDWWAISKEKDTGKSIIPFTIQDNKNEVNNEISILWTKKVEEEIGTDYILYETSCDNELPIDAEHLDGEYIYCMEVVRLTYGYISNEISGAISIVANEILQHHRLNSVVGFAMFGTSRPEESCKKLLSIIQTSKKQRIPNQKIKEMMEYAYITDAAILTKEQTKMLSILSEIGFITDTELSLFFDNSEEVFKFVNKCISEQKIWWHGNRDHSKYGTITASVLYKCKDINDGIKLFQSGFAKMPMNRIHVFSKDGMGFCVITMPEDESFINYLKEQLKNISDIFTFYKVYHTNYMGHYNNISSYHHDKFILYHGFVTGEYDEDLWFEHDNTSYFGYNQDKSSKFTSGEYLLHEIYQQLRPGIETDKLIATVKAYMADNINPELIELLKQDIPNLQHNSNVHISNEFGIANMTMIFLDCNDIWKERMVNVCNKIPYGHFYITDRGVIILIGIPKIHEPDYHRFFKSLIDNDGVDDVKLLIPTDTAPGGLFTFFSQYWDENKMRWNLSLSDYDIDWNR